MTPVQAPGPYLVKLIAPAFEPRQTRIVAVATLEEARDIAREQFNRGPGDQFGADHYAPGAGAADDLPSEGGRIVLPDGTVIEVERITPGALLEECPSTPHGIPADPVHGGFNVPAIVAAFNVAQEAGA